MKAIIIMMALLIGGLTTGYTQTKGTKQKRTAEERATNMTEALTKRLHLAADQKAKVYDLYLNHAKKMEQMRLEASAEKNARMEKYKQMMAEHDKKLQRILNADQFKKYQEYKAISKEKTKKQKQQKKGAKLQKEKV